MRWRVLVASALLLTCSTAAQATDPSPASKPQRVRYSDAMSLGGGVMGVVGMIHVTTGFVIIGATNAQCEGLPVIVCDPQPARDWGTVMVVAGGASFVTGLFLILMGGRKVLRKKAAHDSSVHFDVGVGRAGLRLSF